MISKQNENRIRAAMAEIEAALKDDTGITEASQGEQPKAVVDIIPSDARAFPEAFFTDYGAFYDFIRGKKMFGATLEDDEWKGCEEIIRAFAMNGSPVADCAYGLATAYLETRMTMQPVRESFWLSKGAAERYATKMYDIRGARPSKARELGNVNPGDGAKFMGRGYPQVTGRTNYVRADKECAAIGLTEPGEILADPDLLLRPDIAAYVMVKGMTDGWFTGSKLSDDLPRSGAATFTQFEKSRDIINGRDRDDEIARFAIDFQTALLQAGYKV